MTKLLDEDVRNIRDKYWGEETSLKTLAAEYGVTVPYIHHIVSRLSRNDIPVTKIEYEGRKKKIYDSSFFEARRNNIQVSYESRLKELDSLKEQAAKYYEAQLKSIAADEQDSQQKLYDLEQEYKKSQELDPFLQAIENFKALDK